MRLKNLLLENFQIHKELMLEFSPGVNTLVGESDAGKSAVIRAMDLLLRNQPRGGEELYQSDFSDDPLSIILEDDAGNILERKERLYKLNGNPIKAYGTTIPDQIIELFPMKDINFQFQLEPYFLVLETGGKAAEILNRATGFSEQEIIIDEIKKRTSDSRKLVKTLIDQKNKCLDSIDKLKSVPHLIMKTKAVIQLEKEIEKSNEKINILEETMIDLVRVKEEYAKYTNLDDFKKDLEKICEAESKIDFLNKKVLIIKNKQEKLKELKSDLVFYTKAKKYKKQIEDILALVEDHKEISIGAKELSNKKSSLDVLNGHWMKVEMTIDDLRAKLNDSLKEIGQCPLCGGIIQ
jgi:predicted ATP-dependent endonuclease of OLD family